MGFMSKVFGGRNKEDKALHDLMEMIWKIIDDENFQNSSIPGIVADSIKSGSSVDQLAEGVGVFGLGKDNPVPVNGPLGELAYLSRLETNQGERLLFHRVGAINAIDVFEAVTFSGSEWYVFFMHMYHPRRSRLAPPGFRIASKPRQFSGFSNYASNFPYDFAEAKQATEDTIRLAYIPIGDVMPQIQNRAFNRPLPHKVKLDIFSGVKTSRSDI